MSTFTIVGNSNIRISTFQDHEKSTEHRHLIWVIQKEE